MFRPYKYQKAEYYSGIKQKNKSQIKPEFSLTFLRYAFSVLLVVVGIVVLVSKVLVPTIVIYANSGDSVPIISPIPKGDGFAYKASNSDHFTFKELSSGVMRSVNYKESGGILYPEFVEEKIRAEEEVPDYFYLTIPKLNIENAKVETNSRNLDPRKALGHYNGSCLPGEGCKTFVYGHSSYIGSKNRYKEGDYTTIFSRLGELQYGDEFQINYKGKTYRYVVTLTKVRKPEDVDPLEDLMPENIGRHDNTVELFTCTPPGTTKYRLSVVGKLVS